jgi:hypothetical protein
MSCGLGSRARPSVEFLSCAWLLTFGTPLVDCRKRQTSTATPAEPGGLPLTLGGLPLDQQRVSKLMGAIVSLLHSSTHMVEHPVVSERSE